MSLKMPELPSYLSLAERQQQQLVFLEYQDLLVQHISDLGCTQVIEHQIHMEGSPVLVPYCCQNPHVWQEEERQVKQMLGQGIIHLSQSPWAAMPFMVWEMGRRLRFCIDYHGLNKVNIKDAHPLPRIDDTLEALRGSCYFSTLNLK